MDGQPDAKAGLSKALDQAGDLEISLHRMQMLASSSLTVLESEGSDCEEVVAMLEVMRSGIGEIEERVGRLLVAVRKEAA